MTDVEMILKCQSTQKAETQSAKSEKLITPTISELLKKCKELVDQEYLLTGDSNKQ